MKKLLALVVLVIASRAYAENVVSCDGRYSASDDLRGRFTIKHASNVLAVRNVNHSINGGRFSLDDSILAVFGQPKRIDVNFPQVTMLSIYSLRPKIKLIKTETFGGGIYEARFSQDQKQLVVSNQFGIDVISLTNSKSQSFDAAYIPRFPMQKCDDK